MRCEQGSVSTSMPATLTLALWKWKLYSPVLHPSTSLPHIKGKEGNLQVQVCPGFRLHGGDREALEEAQRCRQGGQNTQKCTRERAKARKWLY